MALLPMSTNPFAFSLVLCFFACWACGVYATYEGWRACRCFKPGCSWLRVCLLSQFGDPSQYLTRQGNHHRQRGFRAAGAAAGLFLCMWLLVYAQYCS